MILEKVKSTLSNFGNYYTSQFVPSSKLYFYKYFDKTYSQLMFSKNDLRIDNEFTIKFNSLIIRFPFIEDLIDVRCKSKSYNEFRNLSHLIIDDYYKRLKEANTLFIPNTINKKDTLFAQNVVNDWRRSFYINIKTIFLFIEKNYSIEIIKKNRLLNTFIKKEKEIFNSLKSNKILDKNKKWNYNRSNRKKKYIPILICKLKSLGLIDFSNYKKFHFEFEKIIGTEFDYNKTTSVIENFNQGVFLDDDSEEFFNKLSFLDSIT